jgi:hypothetical protein
MPPMTNPNIQFVLHSFIIYYSTSDLANYSDTLLIFSAKNCLTIGKLSGRNV